MWVSLISKTGNWIYFSYWWFMSFRNEICEYFWFWNLSDYIWFWWNKKILWYKKYPIWQLLRHSDWKWTLKPTLWLLQDLNKIDKEIYWLKQFTELCQHCIDKNEIIKFV